MTNTSGSRPSQNRSKNGAFSIMFMLGLCIISFSAGSLWTAMIRIEEELLCSHRDVASAVSLSHVEALVQQRLAEERKKLPSEETIILPTKTDLIEQLTEQRKRLQQRDGPADSAPDCEEQGPPPKKRFPDSVNKYAAGMARVNKDNFTQAFDMGVPLDKTGTGNEEVLILYKRPSALPSKKQKQTTANGEIPLLKPDDATTNCDSMHVILTDAGSRRQCIALVPQYQSFHIQNWMRVNADERGPLARNEPLRLVSRGYQTNGREQFPPPRPVRHTRKHWKMLQTYFTSLDDVLKELKILAERVARQNTIVVMVCNHGQSELLMNFACSAKARGISIDNVLVFATDRETKEIVEGLGMAAYFDERNFGSMPSEAAQGYGDLRFVAMMMAKVYCVQLVSMLGYDILFQDVDVVWFRDPLPFFKNSSSPDFDVYFQDDGQHSVRYAPYSANSGFYYVRHNERTQYFLTSLLMAGDLVLSTKSHQQALIALLSEHSSLYGLKVKVLGRDDDEFPGGYQFHQHTGKWMRSFFKGEKDPYIFHMSWTTNKDNKLLFLRQMGEWYVQDICIGNTAKSIGGGERLEPLCCSAEPIISCHYRDKPSKGPCRDSPNIDMGRPSFW